MGLKQHASNTGADFEQPPTGSHSAVCVRVVDMGTQDTNFGPKRKIHIGFEIDERRQDGQRFMAFYHANLSLHQKSNLRGMLESWRGRAYQESDDIDLAALIGAPAMLTLVESENGEYVNIGAVSPLPKGMQPLRPAGDTVVFDCDDPDLQELSKLSERMQEKIGNSPEYRQAMTSPGTAPAETTSPEGAYAEAGQDFDDDIPF